MHIALLGGTGDIGKGLALRWGLDTDHELSIGSRDRAKAEAKAAEYQEILADREVNARFRGAQNRKAAAESDVVILSVPPQYVRDTIDAVESELAGDAIVVTPGVGMRPDDDGFHYNPPEIGSVTELAANHVDRPVVGAFHNLPANRLSDLDADLGIDTVLVGDDEAAKDRIAALAEEIEGLRALDGGPLANAPEIEGITPLLINLAKRNDGMHDVGVRFK